MYYKIDMIGRIIASAFVVFIFDAILFSVLFLFIEIIVSVAYPDVEEWARFKNLPIFYAKSGKEEEYHKKEVLMNKMVRIAIFICALAGIAMFLYFYKTFSVSQKNYF